MFLGDVVDWQLHPHHDGCSLGRGDNTLWGRNTVTNCSHIPQLSQGLLRTPLHLPCRHTNSTQLCCRVKQDVFIPAALSQLDSLYSASLLQHVGTELPPPHLLHQFQCQERF